MTYLARIDLNQMAHNADHYHKVLLGLDVIIANHLPPLLILFTYSRPRLKKAICIFERLYINIRISVMSISNSAQAERYKGEEWGAKQSL
jgi:hypothetical protein